MSTKQKLQLIKSMKSLIRKDWGECKKKDMTWTCFSCLAGLVIQFLDEYEQSIKNENR